MRTFIIYTDGGCVPNPGIGGYSFVILEEGEVRSLNGCGGSLDTTNNRMELTAAIRALEAVKFESRNTPADVVIYSDSKYLRNGITKWIINWRKNQWKTKNRTDVKNGDLWIRLDDFNRNDPILRIDWRWVRGHNGNKFNERCDKVCSQMIEQQRFSRSSARDVVTVGTHANLYRQDPGNNPFVNGNCSDKEVLIRSADKFSKKSYKEHV